MLAFNNDYSHGAHPAVLQALVDTNMEPQPGYGTDAHTERAKQLIREACQAPDADVFFLVGGTQANATVIDMLLAPYEGVVAAETGHVLSRGGRHRVWWPQGAHHPRLRGQDARRGPRELYPGVLRKRELRAHGVPGRRVCEPIDRVRYAVLQGRARGDSRGVSEARDSAVCGWGARLAYALAADECDITLPELAQLCDVFYIGGTKCGALCGEAVVFCGMHVPAHPIPRIKQHGALLAKGRLTGVQFEALFTDGLYFEIGRQAIETAQALRRVLHERGYQFFLETPTNQQFVILPNEDMARIREHAAIEYWEKYDDTHTVVRFCTSWATTQEDIDALAAVL